MAKTKQQGTGGANEEDFMARLRAMEAEARGAALSWSDIGVELLGSALDNAAAAGVALMLGTTDWSYRLGVYPRGRGKGVSFTAGDATEAEALIRRVLRVE